MNEYEFNNQEITIVPIEGTEFYIIEVTRYYYSSKKNKEVPSSETLYRWRTNCQELVNKLQSEKIRTKAFTRQLIVLAKQFGTHVHVKYKDVEVKVKL